MNECNLSTGVCLATRTRSEFLSPQTYIAKTNKNEWQRKGQIVCSQKYIVAGRHGGQRWVLKEGPGTTTMTCLCGQGEMEPIQACPVEMYVQDVGVSLKRREAPTKRCLSACPFFAPITNDKPAHGLTQSRLHKPFSSFTFILFNHGYYINCYTIYDNWSGSKCHGSD